MQDTNMIIRKVKQGDSDAYEKLLVSHDKMIFKLINTIDKTIGDYQIDEDDLYQEACLALFEAARSYENEREVKFSTYAYAHIHNSLRNYVKNYRKTYKEGMYSFDADTRSLRFEICDSTVDAFNRSEFKRELDKFISELDEEDRNVMYMKSEDLSYKEMAERLNVTPKRIDNRIQKLRRKITDSEVIRYLPR